MDPFNANNKQNKKFKLNLPQVNKKILTLILLLISLVFGGVAVFLAITINNRNVNPDDTAAGDPCGGCPGGHYCDSSTCTNPPAAFCCQNGKACACPIPQNDRGGGGGGNRGGGDPCGGCPAEHYCDSTTCRGVAFCCRNGTNCATDAYRQRHCPGQVGCRIEERGLMCGRAAGCASEEEGKSIRFEICPDGSTRDISDKDCVVKNPGCTGGLINNCNKADINPSCGTGKAQEGEVCVCVSNNPLDRFTGGQICLKQGNVLSWSVCSRDYRPNQPVQNCDKANGQKALLGEARQCRSEGPDSFVGRQICLPSGWSECARADGTQASVYGCPFGMTLISGVCVRPCDGSKHICACGQNLCSGNYGQKFVCGANNECRIADASAWLGSGNCRVATGPSGDVGTCSPAEFASCDPPEGQMCWCGGLGGVINHGNGVYYRYGTTEYRGVGACGSTCNDKAMGGIYVAAACGNPYRCPGTPIGDRPPSRPPGRRCEPISYCNPVDSKRYTYTCRADGTYNPPRIEDDPTCRSRSCPDGKFCRGCDLVTVDCNDREINIERNHPICPCDRPTNSIGYCAAMSINIAGRSLRVDTNTPRGGNVIVIPKDQIPWGGQISLNADLGGDNDRYRPSVFWMRPHVEDISDPINRFGTHNHGCSFYILAGDKPPRNVTVTLPTDPTRVIRNDGYNQWNNARCEDFAVNYNDPKVKGIIFGVNYTLDGEWKGDWCRNIGPEVTDGDLFNVGTPQYTACTNPCVIRTASETPTTPPPDTPPNTPLPDPVCQSIQITNARNNMQCGVSNPQACDVRPGDTLNVNLTGVNAEQYQIQGSVTSWRQGITTQTQPQVQISQVPGSNSSFTVVVPNVPDMLGFSIQGRAIARGITSEPPECRLAFNFNDNPDLTKQINRNGSTPQIPQNQNPVIVTAGNIVEYDVTVSNNGTSILGNVVVYDRLININNGTPDNNAPIGVIVSASNLSRTTGNNSQPNPVPLEGGFSSNTVPPNSQLVPHTNNTFNVNNNVIQVRWNRIQAFHPGETYSGKVRVQINNFQLYPGLRNEVCIIVDSNQNNQPDIGEIHLCRQVDVFTQQPNFIVYKTVNNDSPSLSDTITYTITLRNTSDNNLDLTRVTVTDIISPEYANRLTITPSNNGTVQGNTVVWNSQSLIQANGNNSNLQPGGEINLTVQVRFNNNLFTSSNPGEIICILSINNEVRASSNSPDFNATSNTVIINVNNPACVATPTPTRSPDRPPVTRLPPTGIDIRNNLIWIIAIISIGLLSSYIVLTRGDNKYMLKLVRQKLIQQIKLLTEPKIKKVFTNKNKEK